MSSFLPEVTLRAHRERLTLPSASLLLALDSLSMPAVGSAVAQGVQCSLWGGEKALLP